MNTPAYILAGVAIGLLIYALIRGDNLALAGIKLAGTTAWDNLILMILGFLIAGLMQVLLPKDLIANWLGGAAGIKGVLIGCVTGGLIPGSPYVVFPIVGGFYQSGASLGAIVGYLTAWALWSVTRLPVEMALINPKVALIRYAITFIVPPAAGLLAHTVGKFLL